MASRRGLSASMKVAPVWIIWRTSTSVPVVFSRDWKQHYA
jgi:hypothetical protein